MGGEGEAVCGGAQAAVFRTQAQQTTEQGEDAEQCADDEHAEQ